MKRILTFVTLCGLLAIAPLRAADLVIVVNKSCALDNVTSAELTKFFKAEKSKAPDGTKLVIVMQDSGRPERDAALAAIYHMSESEYNDYFVEATFTGAVATAPKAVSSGAAVKKFVSDTAGGLGYVRDSDVDDSVKVVKVDGKAPGDPDYKLKLK
jgi:hypothetical protein